VTLVAHRHKTILRRTSKSIQLSKLRLNSIQSCTILHQNTPQRTTSMKSHTDSVESVFIYPKVSPNNSLFAEPNVIPPQPSTIGSPLAMPILSLILLFCGWASFLARFLRLLMSKQDLENEGVLLQVGLMMPILVLSATRPHL
jgi:hypothetical protein